MSNLYLGIQLLEELGMSVPQEGILQRNSLFTTYSRGTSPSGIYFQSPSIASAKVNPDIQLAVLVNERTFNTALALASYVQDGKLGIVIGTPSANAPSFYANTESFELPYSKVHGQISSAKFSRPDVLADQTTLFPDITTNVGEDSLKYTLTYLKKA